MVLVQKWPLFQLFFLGKICQENIFNDILERKNSFLGFINKKFANQKIWHFSKRVNPWFWSKNGQSSNFLFFGNIGQENIFNDILERKNAFLGYKTKKVQKVAKLRFFKNGLTHGFDRKIAIFPTFGFSEHRPEKGAIRYSRTKKTTL